MDPIGDLPSEFHSNDSKTPNKKKKKKKKGRKEETDFSRSKMKISENFNRQYVALESLVFRGYSKKSQGE